MPLVEGLGSAGRLPRRIGQAAVRTKRRLPVSREAQNLLATFSATVDEAKSDAIEQVL